jgi:putative membrane protein
MFEIQDLTHVNAALNGITLIFLLAGYRFIRAGERERHRRCMLAAITFAALFLISYVIYKANSGFAKFGGEGWIRPLYFSILALHVIGAALLLPMVPWTLVRALKGNFEKHKKLARKTWPMWIYVSVSGIVVYVMAVHMFPHIPG